MELYSELRSIYETSDTFPHTLRVTMKMKDLIDGEILKKAVKLTMKRYPYFQIKVVCKDERVYFEKNDEEIVVLNSRDPIKLGSKEVNHNLMAFAWWKNKIHIDVHHSFIDGAGMQNLFKTLLYYYCSLYYEIELSTEGVMLTDSEIDKREYEDPYRKQICYDENMLIDKWNKKAHQISDNQNIHIKEKSTMFNVRISEKEFMRFNFSNDGTPATVIALFLARAIERVDNVEDPPVVIAMCVNQRRALKHNKTTKCMVGDIRLVYKNSMKKLSFMNQATCFRGMVSLQSDKDMVLKEVCDYKNFIDRVELLETIEERKKYCHDAMIKRSECFTATISYVGKNTLGDIERYIQEFDVMPSAALPSIETPITIEISAINGYFFVNFIQTFFEDIYFKEFIKQLIENDIDYDVLYRETPRFPTIELI